MMLGIFAHAPRIILKASRRDTAIANQYFGNYLLTKRIAQVAETDAIAVPRK
jgi:hypothetical protein